MLGNKRRSTAAEVKEWYEMRLAGRSLEEIEAETGWNKETIRKRTLEYEKGELKEDGEEVDVGNSPDDPHPTIAAPEEKPKATPIIERPEIIQPLDNSPEEEYSEPIDLFQAETSYEKKLGAVFDTFGVAKKSRSQLCKILAMTPQYQTPDGMFSFLTAISAIGPQRAKFIVEVFFGSQLLDQQKNPQMGRGGLNMPGQMPQMPGQPPMMPNAPMNPYNPYQPQYPQYPQYPQQYPGQPPFYSQFPQAPQRQLTPEDIARTVRETMEAEKKKNVLDVLLAEVRDLKHKVENGDSGGSRTLVTRNIPVIKDGKVVKDEAGETVYEIVETTPELAAEQARNEMLIKIESLKTEINKPKSGEIDSDIRRKLEKMESDIKDTRFEKISSEMRSDFTRQLADLKHTYELEAAKRSATGSVVDDLAGLSPDARIQVAELRKQTVLQSKGLDNVTSVFTEGIKAIERMTTEKKPQGVDKVKQFSEGEAGAIMKEFASS